MKRIVKYLKDYKYEEINLNYDQEEGYSLKVLGVEKDKYCSCCSGNKEFFVCEKGWCLESIIGQVLGELSKLIKNNKITKKEKGN